VTFVILDNAQYAAVRVLGDALGAGKLPGVELGGIDFSAVAGGLGCVTYRVETASELKAALAASLAEDRPTLLHVLVDADVPASY
jgi:benzoylformate decarboxylase